MNTKEKLTEIISNVVVNDKGNRIRDVFHPEFVQKIVENLIKHNTIVPPCKVGESKEKLLINDGKSNNSEFISNNEIEEMAKCCTYYHKGEWMLGESGCIYYCAFCGYAAHPREAEEWDFCPYCGAKMKGANDERK